MKVIENTISEDSRIGEDTSLYYRCEVYSSLIEDRCIVGDFSRVTNSELEKAVKIDRNNLIYHSCIGRFTYTGPFDMIFKAQIGDFCSISYGVTIGPPEHDYTNITSHPFLYDKSYRIFDDKDLLNVTKFDKHLIIGSDVWIGCNATILRGVNIGHGAIIGANSLVNKDVPPYAIVAGVPAKILKYRFSPEIIKKLLDMQWWEWTEEEIRKNKSIFLNKPE